MLRYRKTERKVESDGGWLLASTNNLERGEWRSPHLHMMLSTSLQFMHLNFNVDISWCLESETTGIARLGSRARTVRQERVEVGDADWFWLLSFPGPLTKPSLLLPFSFSLEFCYMARGNLTVSNRCGNNCVRWILFVFLED